MKENKAYLILSLLILGLLIFLFLRNSNKEELVIPKNQLTKSRMTDDSVEFEKTYSWEKLGIKPLQSIEGMNYVFSAFGFNDKTDELVIAGNYGSNKLLYVNNNDDKIIEIEISDIPLDIIINRGITYVLCLNKFIIVNEEKKITVFKHNISNVTTFDKLLLFDNNVIVLMSDGSTYTLKENIFYFSKSLTLNNKKEIWIQKTSNNSFEIKSNSYDSKLNIKASYSKDIGSITFLGGNSQKNYVIVDIIDKSNPVSVSRELKCSNDNYIKTIAKLPNRNFSFIKNDVKIHNSMLYTAKINNDKLTIKKIAL